MMTIVVDAAVRSLALAVAVWLALALARARNPHLQKMTWSMVLLAALAMPFLMRAHVTPAIHAPEYVRVLQGGTGAATHGKPAWNSGSALYVLISVALLLRYFGALLRMRRLRLAAQPMDPSWLTGLDTAGWDARGLDVRSSTKVPSPATFGRTILLPAAFTDWSRQKLAAVLAHERSHVLHWDCYVLWLARLYTCIFWFNPMAWWLQRRLAALAETTSDEAAVKALGDRPGYAEILLDFAKHRAVSGVATSMARQGIPRRIETILSEITLHGAPRFAQRMLVIAAFLPAVAAFAAPLDAADPAAAAPAQAAGADGAPGSQLPSVKALPPLMKYYPPEAERKGIDGLVVIRVTLDSKGRATDTLILSEDPLDMGFGAAASSLAHAMEFNNPTGRSAELQFNVKFELQRTAQTHYGTTNFEEPESDKP